MDDSTDDDWHREQFGEASPRAFASRARVSGPRTGRRVEIASSPRVRVGRWTPDLAFDDRSAAA